MELGVKRHGKPARIEVDTTEKCLVIHHEGGEERLGLFSTTRIEIKGARLIVGSEELDPDLGLERPPTVMDIQEFAKFLKQVADSAGSTRETNSQASPGGTRAAQPAVTPQARTTATRPTVTPNRDRSSVNAEARAHFSRAAGIAGFVEVVGVIGAILSAIGGLVIAFNRDDNVPNYYSLTERYPFIIDGITIGVFGAFSMLSISMVAAYIRGRAAEKGL